MKYSTQAYGVLLALLLAAGGLWYLLRVVSAESLFVSFAPEIVLVVLVFAAGFVFVVTQRAVRAGAQYDVVLDRNKNLVSKNDSYEFVVKGLNDGMWEWDLETDEIHFSEGWRTLLHFAKKEDGGDDAQYARAINHEPLGSTSEWWANHIHPDDLSTVNKKMEYYFAGQQSIYEVEYRLRDGGGEYVWVRDRGRAKKNEAGEPVSFLGMTSNIQDEKNVEAVLKRRTTELEAAKKDVEESQARTEAVLESIGEGVVAVDDDGFITVANPAGARMLGLTRESMLGKAYTSVVPKEENRAEEEITKDDRLVYKTLKDGEKHSAVFYYYREDEKKFPVSVTSAPIELDGKDSGVIVVFRDITREMEIDKQKTEFVSLASHQLRTPLSAIRWYSEMVLAEKMGKLTEKNHKYVEEIYTSNLRMIELVNSLLNVSRIEMGTFAVEPSDVDLWEMFESVVRELMPSIKEKDQELVKDYKDAPRSFNVDKNLMRIVFQNLLSNSVKYTQEGGTIKISVHEKGEFLRVEVSDNGYGIPEKDQEHMFEKLYRADNVKTKDTEGTGLGLYIIKSVVEKTGGRIWFDSVEDEGTTFYVELPMRGMQKIEGSRGLEES